ncbi:ABC transporter ATP-binding protein [Alkalihalophilus lindianensis]|uniref:ABC transporter ATP-binding protein n=1 Tax=Alkalihalophilus lindianensis TaxID=1630542 RepID=A0ABU3XDN7_9BACI|nr:ABC transporter ATP-binding protein [Alkalihalophilus lindianensis]MDV2686006.1 ABC transporter ATP-binding protein [Alkalihalophilus lindianensis]
MPFFQVEQLTKKFGETTVVDRVSFSLEEGRCVALLGPNGAGKTTTLKMLTQLLKPTNGTIQMDGYEQNADLRAKIGYLPQYPIFHNWMSGKEFLEYVGKLTHLTPTEAKMRASELLEMMGLADAANRRIGKYSGGMKQRLGIAQAIIHRPKLLLLDEPVSALDPFGRREVLELIRELKKDTTILFSTHVLNDAEEVSDDIIIINQGEIKVADRLHTLQEQHQQPMISLQTKTPIQPLIKEWEDWNGVTEIICEEYVAKVVVTEMEAVKKKMLADIVAKDIPLIAFEVQKSSLEDLFVKVVRG